MKIKLATLISSSIAFIREYSPYGSENIVTMEELKSWVPVNHLKNENVVIWGIVHDNTTPMTKDTGTLCVFTVYLV
ncbi:hypothetical protein [Anaerotignum sp.]|uniref:hypothetical protein n=1 Tax=Anaerotignum sp. TaxID=2039241 RepID=UPI0033332825